MTLAELGQLYAACLVAYADREPEKAFKGPAYLLIKGAAREFNLPYVQSRFDSASELLIKHEVISRYVHPGMVSYYRLQSKDFFSRFGEGTNWGVRLYSIGGSEGGGYEQLRILESYADLGEGWLSDALETYEIDLWADVESDAQADMDQGGLDRNVPASDRLVESTDNHPIKEQLLAELQKISVELDSNNEVGAALGDLRDVAKKEVGDLRQLLKTGRVRAIAILEQAKQTLAWLAKKAAETSVSELAKHALKLFIEWLS